LTDPEIFKSVDIMVCNRRSPYTESNDYFKASHQNTKYKYSDIYDFYKYFHKHNLFNFDQPVDSTASYQ